MKTIILTGALCTMGLLTFAQNDSINRKQQPSYEDKGRNTERNQYDENNQDKQQQDQNKNYQEDRNTGKQNWSTDTANKDCTVMMQNGKVMAKKDGKSMLLEKDMTLNNGTVVRKDGTVKTNTGETFRMKDGDCVSKSGKMYMTKNPSVKGTAGTRGQ
jgi:hypothetical protein